jgi:hypothetical protein
MGQERKGRGRKAGRRKAEVPLRRSEAKIKTLAQSKSRAVRAGADKSQNAEVTRLASELNEALAQQSASSDVLRVINSSPGNLAPVFEAIVDKALRICDAGFGGLWMVEGEVARPAATRNVPKAYSQFLMRQALSLTEAFGSGIEDKPFNHVTDLSRTESYRRRMSLTVASVELGGIRSYLAVPLRDGGALAAVLSVYRKEVRPFSARQITLLQGFAMQAEIAMKNARLLKEPGGAEAPDRDLRHTQGDRELAFECAAGFRGHAGQGHLAMRGQVRHPLSLRRQGIHRRGGPKLAAGIRQSTAWPIVFAGSECRFSIPGREEIDVARRRHVR